MAGKQILLASAATVGVLLAAPGLARADEGGVGFWLPGQLGTLAAVPQTPGWNLGIIDYYTSVSAGGNVAAARQVTIDKLPSNVLVNLNANIRANDNLGVLSPGYVFATPVLGGQLSLSMAALGGWSSADIRGDLTVAAPPFTATRQGETSDSRYGIGDLAPFAALRWNSGVNNWMTFLDGDIPVGMYDSSRLANFGIGHGTVDGGGGYTYFDPQTGHEFSVVTGVTYNFSNPSTDYRNGWDWHLDWGASQFLSKTVQVGVVGYVYAQVHCGSGRGQIPRRQSVTRRRGRASAWLHLPEQNRSDVPQFQSLPGIRRRQPGVRLERLGDPLVFACAPRNLAG
jgi:hypothetical protein